jgi:hypothetical protein
MYKVTRSNTDALIDISQLKKMTRHNNITAYFTQGSMRILRRTQQVISKKYYGFVDLVNQNTPPTYEGGSTSECIDKAYEDGAELMLFSNFFELVDFRFKQLKFCKLFDDCQKSQKCMEHCKDNKIHKCYKVK